MEGRGMEEGNFRRKENRILSQGIIYKVTGSVLHVWSQWRDVGTTVPVRVEYTALQKDI